MANPYETTPDIPNQQNLPGIVVPTAERAMRKHIADIMLHSTEGGDIVSSLVLDSGVNLSRTLHSNGTIDNLHIEYTREGFWRGGQTVELVAQGNQVNYVPKKEDEEFRYFGMFRSAVLWARIIRGRTIVWKPFYEKNYDESNYNGSGG